MPPITSFFCIKCFKLGHTATFYPNAQNKTVSTPENCICCQNGCRKP